MNPELLQRIIALVKQHGERMVLMDQETGEGVVVLDLASYEQLLAASGESSSGGSGPDTRAVAMQNEIRERNSMSGVGNRFQQRQSYSQRESSRERHIPSSLLTEAEVFAQVGEPLTKVVRKKPVTMRSQDLTSSPRTSNINRDIGEWNTSTKSVPQEPIEDEERFYLEPIE